MSLVKLYSNKNSFELSETYNAHIELTKFKENLFPIN